jgi:hypothetical protein
VTVAFILVFSLFVVVTAVLIVATIRWTVRRERTLRMSQPPATLDE